MTLRSEGEATNDDPSGPSRLTLIVVGSMALLALAYTVYLWGPYLSNIGTAGLPGSRAGPDFRAFSVAGSLARAGDVVALYEPSAPAYVVPDAAVYVYPPWFAIAMIPVSGLGFQIGYWLWLGVTASFAGGALAGLHRRFGSMAFLGGLVSAAGFLTLLPGQSAFIVLGLGAVIAWAMVNRHDGVAGTAAALMAFKPHLLIGLGVVWLLRWKRFGTSIVSAFITSAVLYAGSELLLRGALVRWISVVTDSSIELVHPRAEITLGATARLLLGDGVVGTVVSWAFIIGGVVWLASIIRRRVTDEGTLLLAAFGVSVVVSLHALLYDVFVILPALVLVWIARPKLRTDIVVYGVAVLSLLTLNPVIVSGQLAVLDRAVAIGPIALAVFVVWLVETTLVEHRSGVGARDTRIDPVAGQ